MVEPWNIRGPLNPPKGSIKGGLFDTRGAPLGPEFKISQYRLNPGRGHVALAAHEGGFIATYETRRPGRNANRICGRRFNAAGRPLGNEFVINAKTTGSQGAPLVASLVGGNVVVLWSDSDGGFSICYQLFDSNWNKLLSADSDHPDPILYQDEEGGGSEFGLAALDDGGFVAVFTRPTYDQGNLFGQWFDRRGQKIGQLFAIKSIVSGSQGEPSVAGLAGGGFVVVWTRRGGGDPDVSYVKARVFDAAHFP